jgi:hypothetical protein
VIHKAAIAATIVAASMACTRKNPSATCSNGVCTDPQYPFCDVDGTISGTPNACVAVSCTPMEFAKCDGNKALTCNSTGDDYDTTTCPNGCSAGNNGCNACVPSSLSCSSGNLVTCGSDGAVVAMEACLLGCETSPSPHCSYISPRYLPDICDTPATSAFGVHLDSTLDTDTDADCTSVVTQDGAPSLCVVHATTITIDANITLQVVSSVNEGLTQGTVDQGRGFALVADGDLEVAGSINLGGSGNISGPGAGGTRSGGTLSSENGGGGAGFQQPGGAGATSTTDGGAANGGAATMDPAVLESLIGGDYNGGGGGGAATLVSCRGTVSVSGLVGAGGGGAPLFYPFGPTGGFGGGAGGYVVLQGANIQVTGQVYANGGGGAAGGGSAADVTAAEEGQDGPLSTSRAAGGTPQPGAGAGGAGGFVEGGPLNGTHPTNSSFYPGGGGGSIGFFQTYTPAGVTPTLTPSQASPQFQPNATVPTR